MHFIDSGRMTSIFILGFSEGCSWVTVFPFWVPSAVTLLIKESNFPKQYGHTEGLVYRKAADLNVRPFSFYGSDSVSWA